MKHFGIVLLVFSLMVHMMSASLILLDYEVNTAYIIEHFCQNTDRPELKCNGKCHLAKQIKEDSKQKSETPAAPSEILILVLACNTYEPFKLNWASMDGEASNSLYLEGDYSHTLDSIFHPPQV